MEKYNSQIQWVGEIPNHWKVGKILQYFEEGNNKNFALKNKNLLSLSYGKVVKKDITTNGGLLPNSFTTYNIVRKGDVIIRPTDLQNDKRSLRTGYVEDEGIITSAYIDLRPKKNVNSKYFHKLLHSYDVCKVFYNMGNGVRQSLAFVDMAKLSIIIPPLAEQKRIADYLDDKCGQIDDIVADLEHKIDKLNEYKNAMIYKSVTGGLEDDVELKESGIEWLGKVPKHWKIIPNKYLFKETTKKVGNNWNKYQLLSLTTMGVKEKDINATGGKQPENYTKYLVISGGQLILCLFDLDVSAVFCGLAKQDGMITSAYNAYWATSLIDVRFAEYFFRNIFVNRVYKLYSKNVRFTVPSETFDNIKTLVPPLAEQKRIADYLDDKCGQIDDIVADTKKEIEKLKAFKQSLIYEYVTGKKEVPNE